MWWRCSASPWCRSFRPTREWWKCFGMVVALAEPPGFRNSYLKCSSQLVLPPFSSFGFKRRHLAFTRLRSGSPIATTVARARVCTLHHLFLFTHRTNSTIEIPFPRTFFSFFSSVTPFDSCVPTSQEEKRIVVNTLTRRRRQRQQQRMALNVYSCWMPFILS